MGFDCNNILHCVFFFTSRILYYKFFDFNMFLQAMKMPQVKLILKEEIYWKYRTL